MAACCSGRRRWACTARERYLLTGDLLPAEEAWRFGLVTDLTETAEECAALAEKLVAKVAALPPIAVRWHQEIS
jgi:enoyl-CoA hydratase/carnithine racemase